MFEKKPAIKITDPHLALMKMQSWCAYQERCQQDARTKLYELGFMARSSGKHNCEIN